MSACLRRRPVVTKRHEQAEGRIRGRIVGDDVQSQRTSGLAKGGFERAEACAEAIRKRFGDAPPEVGIILGSGLGAFAESLEDADFLPYGEIPGFPVSTVEGHKGRLAYGAVGGVRVVGLQGRFHRYEGYPLSEVTFPVRVFARLGIRSLFVTNAAGGIGRHLDPGDLMVLTDHLNMLGENPLEGPTIRASARVSPT